MRIQAASGKRYFAIFQAMASAIARSCQRNAWRTSIKISAATTNSMMTIPRHR
jgi:hypothetical protein